VRGLEITGTRWRRGRKQKQEWQRKSSSHGGLAE
jgi:hypothetical protein